ncbi:MAG: hypothetical protein CBC47_08410 [Alphaproteobacteria bacterium TMED87]|nr:hypothetical protein [Rhodospirillaceae bacterium]OUV07936.1 MAG: hypothetical protein CBC47_08410 [Alphaproteobacteria bacterium TMED87]
MKPLVIDNISPLGQAGRLGLREGDVVIAKDFEIITDDEQTFTLSLFTADSILTIGRGDKLFDVKIKRGLGLSLNSARIDNSIESLIKIFEEREKPQDLDKLSNFNVLTFFDEFIAIKISKEILPAIIPPVWLIMEGLLLQALAIVGLYALSFLVHSYVFLIVFIITCIYFYRNQIETLLTDKYLKGCQPVIVIAADTEISALDTARLLFPRKAKDEENIQPNLST